MSLDGNESVISHHQGRPARSHCSCLRLEQTSHVFHGEDVNSAINELLSKVEVVLQSVLGLLRVGNVSSVALSKTEFR